MAAPSKPNAVASLGFVVALTVCAANAPESIAGGAKNKIKLDPPEAVSNLGGMVQVVISGDIMGAKDTKYDIYIMAREDKPGAATIKINKVADFDTGATGTGKYKYAGDAALTVGATYVVEVKMYPAGADPSKTKPLATDNKKWTVLLPKGVTP
jgi:hypothetical protein